MKAKFIKAINEGTWAIPSSEELPEKGEYWIEQIESLKRNLYNEFGDDILFDHLDGAIKRIKELITVIESVNENQNEFGEVHVQVMSHPRSDRKILDLLKDNFDNVSFAGGVGGGGWRIIVVEDPNATIEEVSDILFQYIERGVVKTVRYL